MIRLKNLLIYFIVFITFAVNVFASENLRNYIEGIKQYHEADFEQSVKLFEQIAASNVKNGNLFYNLGNANFKAGNIGKSILWFERALKLMPNDPDLKFNFNYVKGFVKDKSEDKVSPVYKILFFWKQLLGQNTIKLFAIILSFIFWILILFQMLKGRKLIKLHTGISFTLAMIFILTASYDYYAERFIKKAIIMSAKVSVRSGLTDDSTELYILHIGTKVNIEENREDYFKIRFSEDKIGWLSKTKLEII